MSPTMADEKGQPQRCRFAPRLGGGAPPGMRQIRVIDTRPDAEDEAENEGEGPPKRFWGWYVQATLRRRRRIEDEQ